MAKNENKLLEELRRRGGICEDPAPEVGGFTGWLISLFTMAKTEHSHPLGMVVSTHFRCGKGVKRGLKNGALPFNID